MPEILVTLGEALAWCGPHRILLWHPYQTDCTLIVYPLFYLKHKKWLHGGFTIISAVGNGSVGV